MTAPRLPPGLVGFLLAVGLGILVRALVAGWLEPALFWDSASYLDYAAYMAEHHRLPGVGMRMPGYPAFLLVVGAGSINLQATVLVQQAIGVLSVGAVFLIARATLGHWALTTGVVLLFSLSADLIFMEATIYSETLVLGLLCWLGVCLLRALTGERHQTGWWFAAGVLCAAALFTRPALQIVPVTILAIATGQNVACRLRGAAPVIRWQALAVFMSVPLVVGGTYALFNYYRSGVVRLATGRGGSLLNYVGRPEVYQGLPPRLNHIRAVYEEAARRHPGRVLHWGLTWTEVLAAERRHTGVRITDPDEALFDIARTAVLSNLPGYVRVWRTVAREYLADSFVLYGLFRTHEVPVVPANAQVSAARYRAVRTLEAWWGTLHPVVNTAGLLFLPVSLVVFRRFPPPGGPPVRLAICLLWAAAALVALANTLVEPAIGQARYRMPWQGLLLVLAWVPLAQAVGAARCLWGRRPV